MRVLEGYSTYGNVVLNVLIMISLILLFAIYVEVIV
jgi:hypothetical protein